jgi:PAS domain S-box-containing protein
MVFVSSGSKVLYANQHCATLLNHRQQDHNRSDWRLWDLIAPGFRDTVENNLQKLTRGSYPEPCACALMDRDGRKINVTITTLPIPYGERNAILWIVSKHPSQEASEKALRESEEKYRLLVENANEAIFVAQDGMIRFYNPKTALLTGYGTELTTRPFVDFIHPDDREMVIGNHLRRLKGEALPEIYPFRIMDREGNTKWVELNTVLISWEGKPATLNFLSEITQRRLAEEAIRESEKRYRSVFENTGTATLIIEDDRTISMANAEFEKLSGYAKEHIEGKMKWDQFVHAEDFSRMKQYHQARRTSKGKVPSEYEFRFLNRSGEVRHIFIRVSIIPGTNKRVASLLDITSRRQAEEVIKRSKEEWERTFDTLPDFLAILDRDYRIRRINKAMAQALNVEPNEAIGRTCHTLIHGTDKPPDYCPHRLLLKDGHEHHVEVFDETMGGYLALSTTPFHDTDGKLIGSLYVGSHINERKKAEQALKSEKEKFQVLVEESPFGVALINKQGVYEYVNPRFVEIFGYTLDNIATGREWFRKAYPDPEYRKRVAEDWKQDLASAPNGEIQPKIFSVRCKDGGEKIIHFRRVTMEKGDQLVIYEDITTQKRLEAQLRQAQKMEAIGTLAGGIAHDFNNILAAIMGFSELTMLEFPPGSPGRHNLMEVINASHRARDMVKQILAFSRQTEQEQKPVTFSPIVKEALKMLRASLPTTIEIHQHIEDKSGRIEADPTQLHQVLMNLCANAGHAMREKGGILEVRLSRVVIDRITPLHSNLQPGPHLMLSVSDTGHGMDSGVLERIFDPYFTTKEMGEGTGLGLAVVHGIIKSHKGAITVQSKPDQGTVFKIYLPLLENAVNEESKPEESLPGGRGRILFVDDEKTLAEMGQKMLEHLGYEVVTKTSSVEALTVFQENRDLFDLVITDVTMPQMTGDKLAKELISIRPDIPIILCTGFSERITEKNVKELGVREFAMKPLTLQKLATSIRNVLDTNDISAVSPQGVF